jgi:hypothetical protein
VIADDQPCAPRRTSGLNFRFARDSIRIVKAQQSGPSREWAIPLGAPTSFGSCSCHAYFSLQTAH